jgi:hypothetical protein
VTSHRTEHSRHKIVPLLGDFSALAPFSLHLPVNYLHSIEKSADTDAHFLLTPEMKSVKP